MIAGKYFAREVRIRLTEDGSGFVATAQFTGSWLLRWIPHMTRMVHYSVLTGRFQAKTETAGQPSGLPPAFEMPGGQRKHQ